MRRSLAPAIAALAGLAAGGSCRRRDEPSRADELRPRPAASAVPAASACELAAVVVADGAWIGISGGARRFVGRCGHALDARAASRELQALVLAMRDRGCDPAIDVGGAAGTGFRDLVVAMDAARMAGVDRIGMSGAVELVAGFPATASPSDRAPADCPPTPDAPVIAASLDAGDPRAIAIPTLAPPGGREQRGDQPMTVVVVAVTAAAIFVNGKQVAPAGASTLGLIPELATALPKPMADAVLVEGEARADATLVARVVRTLSMSGYKDLRFALMP